jgi:cytochrome c
MCAGHSKNGANNDPGMQMKRRMIAAMMAMIGAAAACSQGDSGSSDATPPANAIDTLSGARLADFKGDAGAGEAVFAQCRACHVIDAGINRTGPTLHAVVGRKAGIIEGFHYSAAMRTSGITWSDAKLFEYLESPRRVVPGTAMSYYGLSDPQKRADVIAYLKAKGA